MNSLFSLSIILGSRYAMNNWIIFGYLSIEAIDMRCSFIKIHSKQFTPWLLAIFLISGFTAQTQKVELTRIDPPFWWAGMNNPNLQLMVYGEQISKTIPVISYDGIQIRELIHVESPNYLFINLLFSPEVKPGMMNIEFQENGNTKASCRYEIKQRKTDPTRFHGFDNSDVIYLLMPDRFANGDPSNDDAPGMTEKADRKNPNGRHGGDIKGITNHFDYLNELGVTAIWTNPMLENNMPAFSYHGYAITDLYMIDPRFGTNQDYVNMVDEAHKNGLKVLMDMVFNHLGTEYYWKNDLPMQDWYNQWPEFTRSNYRGGVVSDPHAAKADYDIMVRGWFDTSMADLNQHNHLLAEFLITNSIWWIEYAGLDGIRQDTYPYPYSDFMALWMKRLLEEYPYYNVVGEVWLSDPQSVAYWENNIINKDGYRSNLTNVFDFPLMQAISSAFNEEEGWDKGAAKLWDIISQDYVYTDPMHLVTFADNHDGDRIYSKLGEDDNKFKLAMTFLLTTRGIPQLYYGSEIMMTGKEHKGHGDIRKDFPGGWSDDTSNAFTREGRTREQNNAFDFMKKLLHWRQTNTAVQSGKLTHYIPENGIYVYFRYNDEGSVMVMLNNTNEEKTVDLSRFSENLHGYSKGRSVLDRTGFDQLTEIKISPKSPLIVELLK
ncbi:MAG: alpha-amlyase [Bacteroidetes bacterium CG18_big_fil_WC_8_21_14_2_50_41_14]|nr:MAG: alpha-amlyase [Bacteroidetes bacterium CG18_big_fil_WC_8_21_14_2_50_41_14]PJB56142.1 MAG: alpha-amlyase [Bacteroidetes bacterium CG_4_9_14_3_um_filter_41_19]